jgi:hypothetical protein
MNQGGLDADQGEHALEVVFDTYVPGWLVLGAKRR